MAENTVRRGHARAAGNTGELGYGTMEPVSGGRNPGYAKGGHVAHKQHHVPTAGHHNMDGHIGKGDHHHSHKSHGHHMGVHYTKTGSPVHGTGSGGAPIGAKQSGDHGPSDNQFGSHMPTGGTIGKW